MDCFLVHNFGFIPAMPVSYVYQLLLDLGRVGSDLPSSQSDFPHLSFILVTSSSYAGTEHHQRKNNNNNEYLANYIFSKHPAIDPALLCSLYPRAAYYSHLSPPHHVFYHPPRHRFLRTRLSSSHHRLRPSHPTSLHSSQATRHN
jgi:hypothetical protein